MEEENELKSIMLFLPYVTEEGKDTVKNTKVVFKSVIQKEGPSYNNGNSPIYSMNMSVALPNHIHAKLCGAVVGRKTELSDRGVRTYDVKFSKTISSESLSSLTEKYRNIIFDYRWLINRENMKLSKVIFYTFDGDVVLNSTSKWDGKLMGSDSEISYSYMIGFISASGDRLNVDKRVITRQDGGSVNWEYVTYTEERELFFKNIFAKFSDILSQLIFFKNTINEHSIESILKSSIKLLN
ncbi:MAG: hypothetical protein ABI091_25795 [Ferruginibacter sp.]